MWYLCSELIGKRNSFFFFFHVCEVDICLVLSALATLVYSVLESGGTTDAAPIASVDGKVDRYIRKAAIVWDT